MLSNTYIISDVIKTTVTPVLGFVLCSCFHVLFCSLVMFLSSHVIPLPSRYHRCVRLEAALRSVKNDIKVPARAIREQVDPMHSNRSHTLIILCHHVSCSHWLS